MVSVKEAWPGSSGRACGNNNFQNTNNFSPGTTMPQQQKHATLCTTNELKSEHSLSVGLSIVTTADLHSGS
jgi:hypothetical protein